MSVNSVSGNINSICSLLRKCGGNSSSGHTGSAGNTGSASPPPLNNAMKSAIVSALQKSDSSIDPNEVIQETIQKVLSGNKNVDTSLKIDDQSFEAYLQTLGVDSDALNQDLQIAVGNFQWETGKQPDFSKLYQEPPKGTMVDRVA